MIYELRSKKYLNDLIKNHSIKQNLTYLEVKGMSNTLKIILEDAIKRDQEIMTDSMIINSNNYKYHYEKFFNVLKIKFDNKYCLEAEGYCITLTGKVILNIINYDLVVVLDVTLPYYSDSSIHIYDSVLNLDRLNLRYIDEVLYK